MVAQRGNRFLFDVGDDPDQIANMLSELRKAPWSLTMAIVRDEQCLGMATSGLANLRSLHASVLALFVDPSDAASALALYVRHLFWNFPLRRLHAQVPLMDLTEDYVDLYSRVGFRDEGRLSAHAVIAGKAFDVATLGLLRTDFEDWCDQHEPRLAWR